MARGDDVVAGGFSMTPPDPYQLAWCEMSDLGNAERLAAWACGKLLYVAEWAGWAVFDGVRWNAEDGDRRAVLLAHEVARNMRAEAEALAAELVGGGTRLPKWANREMVEERILALRKWAVQTGNASKTAGMLSQASAEMPATADEFDREIYALNVQNGTLRIAKDAAGKVTVSRRDHDPVDRITRVCATDWDPEADCPFWRARLEKVLPSQAVRDCFQEAIGYAFTGSNREQFFFMHQGRGGDGKTMTMDCLRDMAGSYGLSTDVKTFLVGPERSASDADPALFRMQGDTRLITCGEPRIGQALDDNKVKCFTGGSKMQARPPYGKKILEFVPRGKAFMEVNNKPRIPGADDGIWRRIVVFPWRYQFSAAERAQMLDVAGELRKEWPGILNWVLEGMARWLERGALVIPQEMLDIVEDYRRAANPFGEWFLDRVDVSDPGATIESSALYGDYKDWCSESGVADREIMSTTAFGRALGDRQLIKFKGARGNVMRRGAKLRPPTTALERAPASGSHGASAPEGRGLGPSVLDDDDDPARDL
jgi:putative DNA primase/helicase